MIPATSSKHAVAIVDANSQHRDEVSASLLSFYDVDPYGDGRQALQGLVESLPDLIMVGEEVPPSGGLNFIKAIRQEQALAEVPVIYVIDKDMFQITDAAKAAGADAHLVKPYRRSALINAISSQVNATIEREWEELPEVPRKALKGTVEVFNNIADVISTGEPIVFGAMKDACAPLVDAINNNDFKSILNGVKNHDNYTYAHSMRVATMLSLFGHAAGLKKEEQLILASGGLLHDVGKMLIPHNILNKPGKLDEAEFAIMKTHVPETVKYLRANGDIPKAVIVIAEQHHEKLDGTGYPHGRNGSELNDLARMAAIVDVFSALTDRRVYKPPMEPETALGIMTNEMSTHLDQHFLKMFRTMLFDAVK